MAMLKAGQAKGMIREDVDLYVIRHMIIGCFKLITRKHSGATFSTVFFIKKNSPASN